MNRRTAQSLAGLLVGFGIGAALEARRIRSRFSFYDRTVVITGGARGLGLVMARQLAGEGAQLALLARDLDELRRAESELSQLGADVLILPCDLRDQNQVNEAIQRTIAHFGSIDVLINNAGIIQVGPLEHMTVEDFQNAMAIHFYGPLYTTLAVLPHMQRARRGRIVNISSIGGKIAFPHLLPYTASKFALVGLSDGLRAELRRDNIFVTTVCPGLMRTGSPPNAQFKGHHQREYAWFAISDSLPLLSVDADRAAHKIIEACRRGSARLTVGVQTKAAILLNELFPGAGASLLSFANRLMPAPDPSGSNKTYTGRESQSAWAPSILTRLSEKAAASNNENPLPD
ncbi:SDR family NAD(P)-dependent oxidoreductase [Pedosphaera parvula]|uniref:Short-chain dehydrogenase/reductase SDR n=1 Tax=Pedosphaera parvula (strain Ellin514) TaxID=320771 RepID=B9XRS8_PEDPL|nr:SDR family oxidoreductase [Pedosphaera parvula]EEF57439.1 short-chain dehydrogenase/reductase SDR [Pedosphaera parvula Ellin514]